MKSEAKNPIHSVSKTFDIIEILMSLEEASLSELSTELDMGKGNIHSYLATMEEKGYIINNGGTYRIGLNFLKVGSAVRDSMPLFVHGRPKVEELAAETGELVNLVTEEGGMGVYLFLSQGENAVTVDTQPGVKTHLHNTAFGKAMLSRMPPDRVDDIIDCHGLPASTENTITTESELYEALDTVRERGYATDDEERIKGLQCIAVPIESETGVIGAISISGPVSRIQEKQFDQIFPRQAQSAANVIEINIKYA
jgi:DNA-binding IclR family transcriptional regulator